MHIVVQCTRSTLRPVTMCVYIACILSNNCIVLPSMHMILSPDMHHRHLGQWHSQLMVEEASSAKGL